MRVVVQRVLKASVDIDGETKSAIGSGLLVFLGIEPEDTSEDIEWLCSKTANLRIFDDEKKVMNLSLKDVQGDLLLVSQFTLHASTKKGNRPSYMKAANPGIAVPLYEEFISRMEAEINKKIFTGEFGADMKVSLINDGPVTIMMDSKGRE